MSQAEQSGRFAPKEPAGMLFLFVNLGRACWPRRGLAAGREIEAYDGVIRGV